MERYVDGFVLPVPTENLDEYRELAAEAGSIWIDHGAIEYVEAVGDDLDPDVGGGSVVTFPELVGTEPNETVIFSFIVYRSKEHRDAVNEAVMAQMGSEEHPEHASMPFEMGRMAYGGFRSIVDYENREAVVSQG